MNQSSAEWAISCQHKCLWMSGSYYASDLTAGPKCESGVWWLFDFWRFTPSPGFLCQGFPTTLGMLACSTSLGCLMHAISISHPVLHICSHHLPLPQWRRPFSTTSNFFITWLRKLCIKWTHVHNLKSLIKTVLKVLKILSYSLHCPSFLSPRSNASLTLLAASPSTYLLISRILHVVRSTDVYTLIHTYIHLYTHTLIPTPLQKEAIIYRHHRKHNLQRWRFSFE